MLQSMRIGIKRPGITAKTSQMLVGRFAAAICQRRARVEEYVRRLKSELACQSGNAPKITQLAGGLAWLSSRTFIVRLVRERAGLQRVLGLPALPLVRIGSDYFFERRLELRRLGGISVVFRQREQPPVKAKPRPRIARRAVLH